MKLGRPIGKGPLWWLRMPHFTALVHSVSETHMGVAPYLVVGSRAIRVGRSWETLRPQVLRRHVDGRAVYEKDGRVLSPVYFSARRWLDERVSVP